MARIQSPILFSKYFGVDQARFAEEGLIDPFIDVDTQLFIDPVLLEKSNTAIIRTKAIEAFRSHFSNFIRLLAICRREGDAAWRGAQLLLNLHEPSENGLGYGGSGRSGSSRPDEIRDSIMRTSKEIIELGSSDPEMISLMGFFEENVGPDTISDFTTRVIIKQLATLTEDFCVRHGVPLEPAPALSGHRLPLCTAKSGRKASMVLVPSDIVRELPVANDWGDIEKAAFENARIRNRVNGLLASIAKPTVADRKAALRAVATGSADDFALFLSTVKEHVVSYDPNLDALGYYRLKRILASGFQGLKQDKTYDIHNDPQTLKSLVMDTVGLFKHHVEKGNLWEELWINGKPKKERASQLIYFAIADSFCQANDVDISPEANMGGGPIDFKFSKGYKARVLVEMKRSSGTVKHGYEKQLEIYKDASRTQFGIFVIMDYGDLGTKLEEIKRIQRVRRQGGESASEIVVIDAKRKVSASKRK